MKNVTLYTDGACSGNPGKGGWAAILIYKDIEKELSGGDPETTNNRMELLAVISGLKALKETCNVDIFSDSSYVVNAFAEGWVYGWQAKGFMKKKDEPVPNTDLWKELLTEVKKHNAVFNKVKGHSDNEYNNRCDALARTEIKKISG